MFVLPKQKSHLKFEWIGSIARVKLSAQEVFMEGLRLHLSSEMMLKLSLGNARLIWAQEEPSLCLLICMSMNVPTELNSNCE